jgi:hypothetical protein
MKEVIVASHWVRKQVRTARPESLSRLVFMKGNSHKGDYGDEYTRYKQVCPWTGQDQHLISLPVFYVVLSSMSHVMEMVPSLTAYATLVSSYIHIKLSTELRISNWIHDREKRRDQDPAESDVRSHCEVHGFTMLVSLCPRARHLSLLASVHPGVNWYQ